LISQAAFIVAHIVVMVVVGLLVVFCFDV